jgi:radical SAM protein with 4Fe4S-binding SPASM domain
VSHDAFTGVVGSFQESCENVQFATAAGLRVCVNTIITRLNFDRIVEVIQLGQDLGASSVTFSRYVASHDGGISPSEVQLVAAMDAVAEQRGSGAMVFSTVCIPQCFHQSSFGGCLAGIASCVVDPQGNVRPCVFAPVQCGNLLEQSVDDVWQSDAMRGWREMIPEPCAGCAELSFCHGGCHAAAMMRGSRRDPLMRLPVPRRRSSGLSTAALPNDACPLGRFTMRPEPFGFVLVRGSQITPVGSKAEPVLEACDGRTRLEDLRVRFGQEAIDFIATLYLRGMIELQ